MRLRLGFVLSSTVAMIMPAAAARGEDAGGGVEFFEKKVRPLLADNCYNCHSATTNAKGGLRVDDRGGLLQGGDTAPAVVPGHPEKSLLLKAVGYGDDDLKMPPKKRLSAEQVADLTKWIKDGAAWPQVAAPTAGKVNPKYEKLRKDHWAWQPLGEAKPPAVRDAAWPRDDIDRFILAKLDGAGLKPVADADKLTLIRRVTFDLTGLPPTPEEAEAFVKDDSADAYERVVDRLLASPAYGERWGRHWLDVARYAESTGSSRNVPYPHAWRYRDYVIDAFNADKPFDQFVREQVAGDLLPAASPREKDDHAVATGFLALGVKDVNQRFKVRFIMDNVDEQIDTVSRSVLGLTASCARCHDHKFDPIPQADYYALAGIFRSTDLCAGVRNKMGGAGLAYYDPTLLVPLGERKASDVPPEKAEKLKKELDEAQAAWFKIRGTPAGLAKAANGFPTQRPFRLKFEKLQAEYNALTDPAASGPVALGVRDAAQVADTEIRVRGEAEKLGPVVPRGFLSVLAVPGATPVNPAQSGRLELAQWLASDKNPLTPRVMANRVWQHLFGQGLVRSVDNFGSTGDVPSHPELLDHLAARFVRDGWSVKRLVRAVVLTRAYRLSADDAPDAAATDPAGRLLWRHTPRRLDAEEIRDATLAAAGQLDRNRPAASPVKELPVMEQRNNGPEARRFAALAADSRARSVYLPLLRGWVPTSLEVFDFAEQGMVTGSRDATTVAPQALYLLNDPFVRRQALALAGRLLGQAGLDDAARLDQAYRLTTGRPPTPAEAARATAYLADYEAAAKAAPPAVADGPADAGLAAAEVAAAGDPDGAANPPPVAGGNGRRKQGARVQAASPAADPKVTPADAVDAAPKPAIPVNPDEADQSDAPVREVQIRPTDARQAAWASLAQALIGSGEFRYLK